MSRSLEERYRRMLAWYPQRHRDLYEEEMLIDHGRQLVAPASLPASRLVMDPFGGQGFVAQLLLAAAVVIAAVGVKQIALPVRRWVLALLAPTVAVIVLVSTTFQGFVDSSPRFSPPVFLVTGQWLMLTLTPLLTFALAAALVHRRENRLELLELGRMARRLRTE
jgi:hypothetical protein